MQNFLKNSCKRTHPSYIRHWKRNTSPCIFIEIRRSFGLLIITPIRVSSTSTVHATSNLYRYATTSLRRTWFLRKITTFYCFLQLIWRSFSAIGNPNWYQGFLLLILQPTKCSRVTVRFGYHTAH